MKPDRQDRTKKPNIPKSPRYLRYLCALRVPLRSLRPFCVLCVFFSIFYAQGENWVYRYNGPGDSIDYASSICYGVDGNIYAAGYSQGIGANADFTVISLTSAGDTNWVYRYNGQGNDSDCANSIAYGADGNIYAAGYSCGNQTNKDLIVISLMPRGDTNWVYRYNGPANGNDCANSIAYGADGNIYAAGSSRGVYNSDFVVISIVSTGDTNWVYRYNGPANGSDSANSVVYGSDGNIYVAGYSETNSLSSDFMVISLTPAGDTNWVYLYDGPAHGEDCANSIAYGADGNIYAAGHSIGSGTSYDFTVISLTAAGDANWVYRYNGPGNTGDYACSIVCGTDGNIYAAGYSWGDDFTVINLTPAGDTNWVYQYDGPAHGEDCAYSVACGADGNIYAAGHSIGSGTSCDFTVISLTTAGDTNWVYRYNGPANGYDGANSIVYGADGNIHAAGRTWDNVSSSDFTVISLPHDLGIQERSNAETAKRHYFSATIINEPLKLPAGVNHRLFDIAGRQVMSDRIKPGIYFVEVDGVITAKIIKVR